MTETVEERTRKRRWLSLAELVGVGGLLIAGAGLYFSWADRQEARQEKVIAGSREGRFQIRATASGGALTLLGDERHTIEGGTITFPPSLGIAPQEILADQVERDWFAAPLLKATDGGPDERTGTLPVLLTVRYTDGETAGSASGIYDIVWRTEGQGFPRGRKLTLVSLRLKQRGGTAAALDGLWARASARR